MITILIALIFLYFIICLITAVILAFFGLFTIRAPKIQNNEQLTNYKSYYTPKRYVITLNELKFYNILLEIAKELDLILFAQVSLYNILETQKNLPYKI